MQSDLIGLGGGLVAYLYAGGNPLRFERSADGTQLIRSGKGGEIRRAVGGRVAASGVDADPTGYLRATVERLDALFAALDQ